MHKILIFNRGEIACRVIRTARALGYRTVAVHAADEAAPLHADLADEALVIGADRQAFLSPQGAVEAALKSGADALHPGYGFLSESAELARACAKAGVTFIGPPAEAIEAMGDKASARRRMAKAGVPCVPGYDGADQDDATLRREAGRIGWPLMVKAAAGGGGKGMRLVAGAKDLDAALRAARSEAKASFGSDVLILERALTQVRHVEVQVFADSHGAVLHLGERDCSVQRRHQKLVEETPSPAVGHDLRQAMGEAAVTAARAVGYRGAGTVEFLLDATGAFYFLEMNTRLQVEHPVTEAVTGLDLVAWQILAADGGALPLAQADVPLQGAAIEARLCAESPDLDFLPRAGTIAALHLPQGEGVRIDHGLRPGARVSPGYDPLLAKVIAHGATREEARRRLVRALEELFVAGVETNRGLLLNILRHPAFADGSATTGFIGEHGAALGPSPADPAELALANLLIDAEPGALPRPLRARRRLKAGGAAHRIATAPAGAGWRMDFEGGPSHQIEALSRDVDLVRYALDGARRSVRFHRAGGRVQVSLPERDLWVEALSESASADGEDGQPRSPMDGRIVTVLVTEGQAVAEGDALAVVEAMKMEYEVRAPRAGVVASLWAAPGQGVARGFQIAEILDAAPDASALEALSRSD